MLSNSVIAAGLASAYLTVLFLQVNPSVPIDAGTIVPLALTVMAAYGASVTAAFFLLIVFRQILTVQVLSPGWLSVRVLSWLCAITATGAAAIMWLNLNGFGPVLDTSTTARMSCACTTSPPRGTSSPCGRRCAVMYRCRTICCSPTSCGASP